MHASAHAPERGAALATHQHLRALQLGAELLDAQLRIQLADELQPREAGGSSSSSSTGARADTR
jgi:hypothetical protein